MGDTYWRAFGRRYFRDNQKKLLWLLNHPILGKWFRFVLKIHGKHSSVGNAYITRIMPHAIFWRSGVKHMVEFRTHAKFSKRLYYAFSPVWWAMHYWDWLIADRFLPELSFGFDTLTEYPDPDPESSTVDGTVEQNYTLGSGVSFATIVAAAGTGSYPDATDQSCMWIASDNVTDQWRAMMRGIFLFDTSALGSGASISDAVLSLYGSAKGDAGGWTPDIDIYTAAPASDTALVGGDYDSLGATSQTGDSPISYGSWDTSGYNDFTFDATGRGNVDGSGISKFGSRNANYEVAGSPPTWGSNQNSYVDCYLADQTGTTNDPKLVVTYTPPAASLVGSLTTDFDNTANPVTVSHTPGSACKGIILGIVLEGTAQRSGGAPTISAAAMTQADTVRGGTSGYETSAELWYKFGSFDGSQIDISVPNTGTDTLHFYVRTFTAPDGYNLAWADDDGYVSTSTGSTLNLTHGVVGSIGFAVCGNGEQSAGSTTETGDTVEDDITDQGSATSCFGYAIATDTGTMDLGWDWSDDGEIVAVVFTIAESGGDATFSVSVLSGSGSIYSTSLSTGHQLSLGLLTGAASINSISLSAGHQLSLSLLTASGSTYPLDIALGQTVPLGLLSGSGTINTLSLSTGQLLSLGLLSGLGSVYPVTLSTGQTLPLGLLTGTGTPYALTQISGITVFLNLLQALGTVNSVNVVTTSSATVPLSLLSGSASIYSLAVSTSHTLALSLLEGTGAIHAATVLLGDNVAVALGVLPASASIHSLSISADHNITLSLLEAQASSYGITMTADMLESLSVLQAQATMYGVTLSLDLMLSLVLQQASGTIHSLSLSTDQLLSLALQQGTASIYAVFFWIQADAVVYALSATDKYYTLSQTTRTFPVSASNNIPVLAASTKVYTM